MSSSSFSTTSVTFRKEISSWLMVLIAVLGVHSLVAKPFYIPSESMMPGLWVGDRLLVSKYAYGWSYASASFHLLPPFEGRLFERTPSRGDIVVLDRREISGEREDLIKRVIGLPGDTVQLVGGRLWLNGRPVQNEDLGWREFPIDSNFHCDSNDPDPKRRFPGFYSARVYDRSGKAVCRIHIFRETLPGGASYETADFGAGPADDTPLYKVPPKHLFVLGDNRDDSADSRVAVEFGGLGGPIPLASVSGRAERVTFSLDGSATWNPLTWIPSLRKARTGVSLRPTLAR